MATDQKIDSRPDDYFENFGPMLMELTLPSQRLHLAFVSDNFGPISKSYIRPKFPYPRP